MQKKYVLSILSLFLITYIYSTQARIDKTDPVEFISYIVNPAKQDLKFYWKNKKSKNYYNFQNLKNTLASNNKELVFAMNGGMYKKDGTPQGLYIEEGKTKVAADRKVKGYGNFYMQPNGIFYLTKEKKGYICSTENFKPPKDIEYATQSGPMLVVDGKIHPKFGKESTSTHIRNGVGILKDGRILFAISKEKINLYNFADFFRQRGCKDALYLDGYVSRAYIPHLNIDQRGGNFGVIIAETKKKKS